MLRTCPEVDIGFFVACFQVLEVAAKYSGLTESPEDGANNFASLAVRFFFFWKFDFLLR